MRAKPRKIDSQEYNTLKALQDVFNILLKYNIKKLNFSEFTQLSSELEKYKDFSFMTEFNKIIDRIKNKYSTQQTWKINFSKNYTEFKGSYAKLIKSILSKNYNSIKQIALNTLPLTTKIIESYKSPQDILDEEFRNPFYYENLWIFGDPNTLLKEFSYKDLRKFAELNLDKYCYSYLPFPKDKELDWLLYYIKHLKSSNEEVELSNSEFIRYQKFLYMNNPKFEELVKLVDKAMHRNDKTSVNKVLTLIKKFPEIDKRNKESKSEIEVVFRGIPDTGIPIKEVLKKDQLKGCVSASISKRAARNFALQIGHLEPETSRRSEVGYIITYNVNYDSVLLDTRIFGSLFNEDEILIDPKKATVVDVESV